MCDITGSPGAGKDAGSRSEPHERTVGLPKRPITKQRYPLMVFCKHCDRVTGGANAAVSSVVAMCWDDTSAALLSPGQRRLTNLYARRSFRLGAR